MSPAVAAAMGGHLDLRVDVVVVEVELLVITDRPAASTAHNLLPCPDPSLPLAATAPMRRAVALPVPTVAHQPCAS